MLAKPERKAHPVADLFPMMTDGELDELAADIKARGQQVPILVDHAGAILDGRNRWEACRRAGVEARIETIEPEDPLALVVSLNVKRRSLRAGQKAIAAAEAWNMAPGAKIGTDEKRRDTLARLFGISKTYVQMARALVLDDPIAAAAVKADDEQIAAAYEQLQKRAGSERNKQFRLKQMRADRPDLVEQIDRGSLTLEAAEKIARDDAEQRKQQRWAATMNLLDGVKVFDRPVELAADLVSEFDEQHAAGRGETITLERLRNVAAFAAALANTWEETHALSEPIQD